MKKNNFYQKGKIYRVEWTDSYFIHGWQHIDNIEKTIKENKKQPDVTIGILVYQDDNCIALAHSKSTDNVFAETIVIPKKIIVSYKELKNG